MGIQLVPDPTFQGRGTAPLVLKSEAMRKLHAAGQTVSQVAIFFDVSYHNAYATINPPRRAASSGTSTAPKPLTRERATQLSKSKLIAIATSKITDDSSRKRVIQASDELDRRYPGWLDAL